MQAIALERCSTMANERCSVAENTRSSTAAYAGYTSGSGKAVSWGSPPSSAGSDGVDREGSAKKYLA